MTADGGEVKILRKTTDVTIVDNDEQRTVVFELPSFEVGRAPQGACFVRTVVAIQSGKGWALFGLLRRSGVAKGGLCSDCCGDPEWQRVGSVWLCVVNGCDTQVVTPAVACFRKPGKPHSQQVVPL
eukprot:308902-Chlamydomonas_euryale.AAC.2